MAVEEIREGGDVARLQVRHLRRRGRAGALHMQRRTQNGGERVFVGEPRGQGEQAPAAEQRQGKASEGDTNGLQSVHDGPRPHGQRLEQVGLAEHEDRHKGGASAEGDVEDACALADDEVDAVALPRHHLIDAPQRHTHCVAFALGNRGGYGLSLCFACAEEEKELAHPGHLEHGRQARHAHPHARQHLVDAGCICCKVQQRRKRNHPVRVAA
mmetsp:Transcript_2633/g.4800  ORF Transcript_2633/g.4800 Transcript_2633/m.4800 type:complete len:213 (+) Transcript_2633:350-988(+)